MVCLVVFDMDGMLLMFDYYLGREMIVMLLCLCECDIILIFVMGCYVLEMWYILGMLLLDVYFIISNGM